MYRTTLTSFLDDNLLPDSESGKVLARGKQKSVTLPYCLGGCSAMRSSYLDR
jgi:hypothetical protein